MKNVYEKLAKAHKVACPIVTFTTSDPAAASVEIAKSLEGSAVIQWDCSRGCREVPLDNGAGARAAQAAGAIGDEVDLHDALVAASGLDRQTVLIIHNAQRFLDRPDVIQAIWNLRDEFKGKRRMLVLMGPSIVLPPELKHDVFEIDEPLPTEAQLRGVVSSIADAAKVKLSDDTLSRAAAASSGMSAFEADQLAALNISKQGLDVPGVWDDKCKKISETPGLKVVTEGTFEDIGGCWNIKEFLTKIMSGPKRPNGVIFVDEIEKALGGSQHDTSGVSQDQLGVLLQYMQDRRATGCIFAGPPGAAKSAIAKRAGAAGDVPTIQFDLGGMKDSLVGGSEGRIREALKVIDAVTGGNTIWLATANNLSALPPELRRRFRYGTWFFDLPGDEERRAIWRIYSDRYGLEPSQEMIDMPWTGAEIESCCEIADRTGSTLEEAAAYIVPVSRSAASQIEQLEAAADGNWISASYRGPYRKAAKKAVSTAREFD